MQVAPDLRPREAAAKPFTQPWVSVALLIGAAIALGWATFLVQFRNEPSAIGPTKAALVAWFGVSLASAVLAVPAAAMLLRRNGPGRPLAWIVAILQTASCIGAIAGVPALIGLWSSRR